MDEKLNRIELEELEKISGGAGFNKGMCLLKLMSTRACTFDANTIEVPINSTVTVTVGKTMRDQTEYIINFGGTIVHCIRQNFTKSRFVIVHLTKNGNIFENAFFDVNCSIELTMDMGLVGMA